MKKIACMLVTLCISLATITAKAQNPAAAAYFAGSWSVLLKGTPNGDVKMIFKFDKGADTLTGVVQDSTGAELSVMSTVELGENQVTAYFTAQGYDVNVVLTKKDDDHAAGSLLGMFDVDAERKKK